MAIHAGFAYAIQIRKRALNDSILLAYHTEKISRRLFSPFLTGGPPAMAIDFHLDPPLISFDDQRNDVFILTLKGAGRLTVDFDPTLPESREIRFEIVALVAPRTVVGPGELRFAPTREDLSLSAFNFSVIAGGPFSANASAYLAGAVFRERLEANLAQALTSGVLELPPIKLGELTKLIALANTSSIARVLDQSIVIGLNISSATLNLQGQIQELNSFAGSHDIALALNPAVLPVVLASSLAPVTEGVAAAGATLDSLTMTAGNSKIAIAGAAHNDFGSVKFSLNAVLALFASRNGKHFQFLHRPVHVNGRIWPAIRFHAENIQVDVNPATWVRVVEVAGALVTGAVVPLVIEDLIRGAAHQILFATKENFQAPAIARVQHLEPERVGDPRVKLRINEFSISPDVIFGGLSVTADLRDPVLMGLTSIPANYLSRPIRYRVIPPIGVFDDDPYLRIRWRVQDLSSGQLVVDEDGAALARLVRELRVSDFGGPQVALGISCELYRRVGTVTTPIFSDGIQLAISSPLLPDSLVRWRYTVKNPQVAFSEKDEEWKFLGESTLRRWSAVHRLDKPCKMANERSRFVDTTQTLDDFPYPLTEIENRREGLCAFCFFGGPGEKRPSL